MRCRNKKAFTTDVVTLTLSQLKVCALRADGGAAAVNTPEATLAMLERHFADLTDVNVKDILAEPFDPDLEGLSGREAADAVAHLLPPHDADAATSASDSGSFEDDTDAEQIDADAPLDEAQSADSAEVEFAALILQTSGQHASAAHAEQAVQQRAHARREKRANKQRARGESQKDRGGAAQLARCSEGGGRPGSAGGGESDAGSASGMDADSGADAAEGAAGPSGGSEADASGAPADAHAGPAGAIGAALSSPQTVVSGSPEGGGKELKLPQSSMLGHIGHAPLAPEATQVLSTDADCGDERDDAGSLGPSKSPSQQRAPQQTPATPGCAVSADACEAAAVPAVSVGAAAATAGMAAATAAAATRAAADAAARSDALSGGLSAGLSAAPSLDAAAAVARASARAAAAVTNTH